MEREGQVFWIQAYCKKGLNAPEHFIPSESESTSCKNQLCYYDLKLVAIIYLCCAAHRAHNIIIISNLH